jgi:hypothetical protein
MQVTPLPLPVTPNAALPQDAVAKTMPNVVAQASTPVIQRAVDPSSKSERGQQSRSNGDRAKGGGKSGEQRGGSVNMRV